MARGERSSARTLSLAHSSGADHRESGDWRGASCGERRRCPHSVGYRTMITHTFATEPTIGWPVGYVRFLRVPVSQEKERDRRREREKSRDALARAWTYTYTRCVIIRVLHAAEHLSATHRGDTLAIYRGRGFPS